MQRLKCFWNQHDTRFQVTAVLSLDNLGFFRGFNLSFVRLSKADCDDKGVFGSSMHCYRPTVDEAGVTMARVFI